MFGIWGETHAIDCFVGGDIPELLLVQLISQPIIHFHIVVQLSFSFSKPSQLRLHLFHSTLLTPPPSLLLVFLITRGAHSKGTHPLLLPPPAPTADFLSRCLSSPPSPLSLLPPTTTPLPRSPLAPLSSTLTSLFPSLLLLPFSSPTQTYCTLSPRRLSTELSSMFSTPKRLLLPREPRLSH